MSAFLCAAAAFLPVSSAWGAEYDVRVSAVRYPVWMVRFSYLFWNGWTLGRVEDPG